MGLFSDVKSSWKEHEAARESKEKQDLEPPPQYPAGSSSSSMAAPPPPSKSQLPPPPPQGSYHPPPPQQHFGGSPAFPVVLLSSTDKIRMLGFPNEGDIQTAITLAIQRVWAPGIQRSRAYEAGGWEWKLSGRPWYGYGEEGTHSRRLIANVLYELAARGWHLLVSTSLTKKEWDKDTLIFRAGPPVQRYFFPVSFHESDKVRITDSPNPQVTDALSQAVHTWIPGIQNEGQKYANSYQFKLRGTPWYTQDGVTINHARLLICEILKAMDAHGFELLASVDMNIGNQNNSGIADMDTWFFASKM